jgi:L-threonylcarbamoyladenylate synthase
MKELAETGVDIFRAKELLETGELVGIPTETVYGLAANALDALAVAKIFQVKDRPSFDPLIVHIASFAKLNAYVREIPQWAEQLAEKYWPGPLTLVLPKHDSIPDIVTSGLETVAIRVPNHSLTLELLAQLAFPLAAPSANPFGFISPTTAQHVLDQLGREISYVLDGGPCAVGVESTIVGEVGGKPTILRFGGLSQEEIESVIGHVEIQVQHTSNLLAPGGLESHYAPRHPVRLGTGVPEGFDLDRIAALRFTTPLAGIPHGNQRVLSPKGDLVEAATNLFAALRDLDKLDVDLILAEPVPNLGLGRAINDRLKRASAKY